MLREFRVLVWQSLSMLLDACSHLTNIRAAKVCGCDNCRLLYDDGFRAQRFRDMLANEVKRREAADRARMQMRMKDKGEPRS